MKQPNLFEAPPEALANVEPEPLASQPLVVESHAYAPDRAPAPDPSRSRAARIVALASQGVLTDAERGELDLLLEREVPVDSPRLLRWLYKPPPVGWGIAPRYIKEGQRNTTRLSRSADALLSAYRVKKDARLELCLRLMRLRAEAEALSVKVDRDP